METSKIPGEWHKNITVNLKNYRRICLLSIKMKSRSTTNVILLYIIQQVKEKPLISRKLHTRSIDLTKALDRVRLIDVVRILVGHEIPQEITRIIQQLTRTGRNIYRNI